MSEITRRCWAIQQSPNGVPRFSSTHLFERDHATALCGLLPPRQVRDAALVSGAGTPLCQKCAAVWARRS
jgi:hypothetical protein